MLTRTHGKITATVNQGQAENQRHAIQAFGFLLPFHQSLTWAQFGALIANCCAHPAAQALARVLIA